MGCFNCSGVTKKGTVTSFESSLFNLNLVSIQPLYGIVVPLAAVKFKQESTPSNCQEIC